MRRRTTAMILTATLLLVAGCSDRPGTANGPVAERDLCRLVQPAELPHGEQSHDGFPKANGQSCRWVTDQASVLTIDVTKLIEASLLGDLWRVQPRQVRNRDVYVRETPAGRAGGPQVECSAGFQQKNDTVKVRYRVGRPRPGVCDDLIVVVEKAIRRLSA